MAAKTWETDFRYPAIKASIRAIGEGYFDDPFAFPGSFCTPVAERPLLGWTPGKITLVMLVLGFALLIGGALLGSTAERAGPGAGNTGLMVVAVCCSVGGIITFFVPSKFHRQIVSWLIGARARELAERSGGTDIMAAELSDSDRTKMAKLSIDGDDHVLIFFDDKNCRLLIEGVGARYQIRAADVRMLAPFTFKNYLGVEIAYQIDPHTQLQIAIARVSILLELVRQVPILWFLRGWISNKLLTKCLHTLQMDDD